MFAVLCCMASIALLAVVGISIASIVYHTDLQQILANINDASTPQHIALLRFFLLFQTFLMFGVPPLVITFLFNKPFLATFWCNTFPKWQLMVTVLTIMFISFPIINLIADYNGKLLDLLLGANNVLKQQEDTTERLIEAVLSELSVKSISMNLIAVALFPAVFEELFFRGLLQNAVLKKYMNVHWAIFITAFIFSFIHFQFYGFIPRLLLGLFFGYVMEWSKSLWTTIIAHCLNNGLAVVLSILIANGFVSKDYETFGTQGESLYITSICIIITAVLVWKLIQTYSRSIQSNTI